jgi:hypothetical protein
MPYNTTLCVRGFSNHILIKSHLGVSLNLETLDASIWISLVNILIDEIDWNYVMLLWRYMMQN